MKSVAHGLLGLGFVAVGMGAIPSAFAQQKDISGFVTVGAGMAPDYEGSDDYTAVPLLGAKLEYDGYYIETRGLGLRANVSPWSGFEFGPAIGYNGGRDDDVDSARVAALREIDSTVEAGLFLKYRMGQIFGAKDELALNLDVMGDAGDAHEGYTVKFGPSYGFAATDRLRLGTSLAATYASDDYNQTYFGIDANNAARSGLARYDAEAGIKDVSIGVNAMYSLTRNWGLTANAQYKQLVGDAADSPIVDQEGSAGQVFLGLGVMYRF